MATDEDPPRTAEGSEGASGVGSRSEPVTMGESPKPPASSDVPAPGDVLAGKYRVERVVGIGGMGVVVAAQHIALEERVALKLLKRDVMRPDTIARFLQEARSAAKIKSEHVARVTDVGTLGSGVPYMVMELLEGEDLGHLVHDRGPLAPSKAADYLLQACEAIAEAHTLGIVHRDLKPSNLFLARRPGGQKMVKVVDFGISKQMSESGAPPLLEDAARTRTSAWLGSPLYMSPEQMRSARDVDHRTDIWALGLILFELCTEHVPFDAPSIVELCGRVLHDEPTPLETWLPDPPPVLASVIDRCLRKNRDERFADVGQLALALAPLAPGSRARVDRIVAIAGGGVDGTAGTDPVPSSSEDALPLPLVRPSVPARPEKPSATNPEAVAAHTSIRPEGPRRDPEEKLRQRGALWLLLLVVLAGGAGGAFLRAGAGPFAPPREIRADTAPSADPPPAVVSAAPLPPAPVAVVPAPVPMVVDAGEDAGRYALHGGVDAGALRRGERKGPIPAAEPPSGMGTAPVPASALKPEVIGEACFQNLPDGTRKPIACP
jgi:eukaryotic-like serine/threonine-protein kinase